MISTFDILPWQMDPGERAALEGLLCQIRPNLSIEIGTADGGSLRSIARYSGHVHSFDLAVPPNDINELANVTIHTGDSHVLLPEVLDEIARDDQNVDFVLVDGDHTSDGVERDTRDLLASAAVNTTVIVFHDTMNDEVRAGLAHIDIEAEPKVTYYDPDFLAGRLHYRSDLHHQLWGGFGVMVLGAANRSNNPPSTIDPTAYATYGLVTPVRDALVAQERNGDPGGPSRVRHALAVSHAPDDELLHLRAELAELQRAFDEVTNSKSWRLTTSLRAAARLMRNGRT
jgi:hypothetical protein